MKHFHSILSALALAVCTCIMSSCLNDYAQSSPELRVNTKLFRTTMEGVHDTIDLLDTLMIGDTLRLPVMFMGGFNILTSFQVQCDPAAHDLQLEVDSAVATVLGPGSDLTKGKIVFPADRAISMCTATLRFVPLRSGNSPINMTVANNASEKFSPRAWSYTPNVK